MEETGYLFGRFNRRKMRLEDKFQSSFFLDLKVNFKVYNDNKRELYWET